MMCSMIVLGMYCLDDIVKAMGGIVAKANGLDARIVLSHLGCNFHRHVQCQEAEFHLGNLHSKRDLFQLAKVGSMKDPNAMAKPMVPSQIIFLRIRSIPYCRKHVMVVAQLGAANGYGVW